MAKGAAQTGCVSRAVLKNFRVPPRKARLVADVIRGHLVEEAIQLLDFCDKKTAPAIRKLLVSAAANAKNVSNVDVDELVVKRIWVNEGRKFKRFMPRAHGRATPIRKRHSTITVMLDEA